LGLQRWQQGLFALHNLGQVGFLRTRAQAEGASTLMQGALEFARRVVREING